MAEKYSLKPVFLLTGEISNYGLAGVDEEEKMYKTLRAMNIPGLVLMDNVNGVEEAKRFSPFVDYHGINLCDVPISVVKDLKRDAFNIYAKVHESRFERGFYAWRVGARGFYDEFYFSLADDPFNDFDNFIDWPSISYVRLGPDGPIHMPLAEKFREGLDDTRYLFTLTSLVKKAQASGKKELIRAAQEANTAISSIMGDVNEDFFYYYKKGGWWNSEQYDAYRWQIAQKIMDLKEVFR